MPTASCAYVHTPLAPNSSVQWRTYMTPRGVAPDGLAEAAQILHSTFVATRHVECPTSISWLMQLRTTPLYALEGSHAPHALWLFLWHDMRLSTELENYLQSLVLHSSGEYRLSYACVQTDSTSATSIAHTFFLRAVCNAVADCLCDEKRIRVASGLLKTCAVDDVWYEPRQGEYTTFRAYTTQDTLYVMCKTIHVPWTPLDVRVIAGDALPRDVILGKSRVRLVPTLQRATLMSTYIETHASPLAHKVRQALSEYVEQDVHNAQYAVVHLHAGKPPFSMPMEGLSMRSDGDSSNISCTILWPVELCLLERADWSCNASVPWTMRSASELLASDTWADAKAKSPPSPHVHAHSAYMSSSPLPSSPYCGMLDDDMFRAIRQLTEDDLSFFETPRLRKTRRTSTPALPPIPSSASSLAHDAPAFMQNTDAHGRFWFAGQKRAWDDDIRHGSPRFSSGTPQSAGAPGAGWYSSSPRDSVESHDMDAPECKLAQCALALARLHTSAMTFCEEEEERVVSDTSTQRVHLAWTALYGAMARRSITAPALLPPLLSTPVAAEALCTPSILVGCQHALVQMSMDAVQFWSQLALRPVAGERTIRAHVVLVETDVPHKAVEAWMLALSDAFCAHALGTLVLGHVWRMRLGQWVDGSPADMPKERSVVYLVYGDESRCERLFCAWPMPRADISIVTVPESDLWTRPPRRILVWASYEDSLHRVCHIAPRTYEACKYLCEQASLRLAWPSLPSFDPLHHGAVLHVAYDIVGGEIVRLVCTDDRAQRLVCRAWDASCARTDIPLLWQVICTILAETSASWHIVIGRLGAMSLDEMDAWKSVDVCHVPFVLSVGILSLERNVWPAVHAMPSDPPLVVFLSQMPLALSPVTPIPVPRSAYLTSSACAVHLIHLFRLTDLDAYIRDVIIHWHALQCMAHLRWTDPKPYLPWHFAILACT